MRLFYASLADNGSHLPQAGGMGDQAAIMVDAFTLCARVRAECQALRGDAENEAVLLRRLLSRR